ncbi:PREDICTED: cytochrome P450 3A13-like, partial [Rhagoletis zephyria]|uniref:cytochrome P450 3A13-like n=1 Tax=Rhagoletis zephyria TaxID=28612 RepID=UPI0008113D6B
MLDAQVDEAELNTVNYDGLTITEESGDAAASEKNKLVTNGKQKSLTKDEIVANCLIFFIGGFETTQSTISHCLFELARYPDIQEQLYGDLKRALDKFASDEGSDEYYETIMNSIPLLEAVIKETLRLYPPISMMSRICNTDGYRLGSLVLQKNDIVSIPTCAIHQNPEFYPDPFKFKPS